MKNEVGSLKTIDCNRSDIYDINSKVRYFEQENRI